MKSLNEALADLEAATEVVRSAGRQVVAIGGGLESGFRFGSTSERNLLDVHPKLVLVMRAALKRCPVDFSVISGLRTKDEQEALLQAGKTWTLNSLHCRQPDGYAHAVDLWPVGAYDDRNLMHVWSSVLAAADALDARVTCGGDWNDDGKTDYSKFDGWHFQLTKGVNHG